MAEGETKKHSPKKHKHFLRKKVKHNVGFGDIDIYDHKSSMTLSCTLLISLSQLFCGVVIPLSDSFVTSSKRDTGTSYYLEIFLILQYSMAILGICYLQLYIYINERTSKAEERKSLKAEYKKEKNNDECSFLNSLAEKEFHKVKFNLSPSFEKDEISLNMSPTISEQLNQESLPSMHSILQVNHNGQSETSSLSSQNIENLAVVRDTEGINLYLRLGAVGFGFGVMVHDGFKIADQMRLQSTDCYNNLWTPKHCLHLTYIFFQTFFIFKYHKVIFSKQKPFLRFILCQLAVINICQWFKSVVFEINEELAEHEVITNHPPGTDHYNISHHNISCVGQLSNTVSPYLFPCAIEYGLICGAIFYKILQKVGRLHKEKLLLRLHSHDRSKYSGCHRSHKGLFVGLLFFMATLVGLATFLVFKKKSSTKNLAVMVYQLSEIILLLSSLIALICAFIKMRVLKFRQLTEEEALDDNLVLIGWAGVFGYNLFIFISTIDSSFKSTGNKLYMTLLMIIFKSLTEIMQSFIQVLFILEGSRKCAGNEKDVCFKPGRSYLTFLIITNLALWIVSIFEAKRAEEHLLFTNYYQKTPWSIIMHTLLPLIIFFRFHSTVCLSDIWTNSYKIKISKKPNPLQRSFSN